ncbi:MAG: hypothetical protein ACI8PZ_003936 [Myxococcota bacterium]|jgi:hypothetical protein
MFWLVTTALAAPFAEEICVESLSTTDGLAPLIDARPLFEPRDLDAYRSARMFLDVERMPPPELMRPESFVAYFRSDYASPDDQPVAVTAELVQHPVLADHRILRVGVQARRQVPSEYETSQVTLLVDVSPSMDSVFSRRYPVLPGQVPTNGLYPPVTRLDLVRHGLRGFASGMARDGRVAVATYSGDASVVLPPTSLAETALIDAAADQLRVGTRSWSSGLDDAYALASEMYIPCMDNRLVLLTDYNAKIDRDLKRTLTSVAALGKGLEVSAVGVGLGERGAGQLEQLSEIGLGNTWYADTAYELDLAFAREFSSGATVAREVTLSLATDGALSEVVPIGWEDGAWDDLGNLPSDYQRTVLFDLHLPDASTVAGAEVRWSAGSAIPGQFTTDGVAVAGATLPWIEAPADLQLTYVASMFAGWLARRLDTAWTLPQLADLAEQAARAGHPEDRELAALIRQAHRIDEAGLDRHHRR